MIVGNSKNLQRTFVVLFYCGISRRRCLFLFYHYFINYSIQFRNPCKAHVMHQSSRECNGSQLNMGVSWLLNKLSENNLGVLWSQGELGGRELCQSKAHPRLSNTSPYKVWQQFQCEITTSPFDPLIGGQGGPIGSKIVPIEISSPHSYSTSMHTHQMTILHCLATIHNAADRHTDRMVRIGRLCNSIGVLKTTKQH